MKVRMLSFRIDIIFFESFRKFMHVDDAQKSIVWVYISKENTKAFQNIRSTV